MKNKMTTHHVRFESFDESYFPYRKQSIIHGHVKERLESQLRVESPVRWKAYDKKLPRSAYEMVHYDPARNGLVMRMVDKSETFVSINIST